ncbi:glycosyltransferase 87 family protein [Kitasatospora sp. NPDC002965]|uniref:glycosyltransferase 87 family protein n=1 Tax=Kitasatospora sp. NPDC002965 TaxID=3154775 RepID=UPI0033BF152D
MSDSTAEPRRRATDPTVLTLAATTAVGAALLCRILLLDGESSDYFYFLGPWYRYIAENGGFAALSDMEFSDYNAPYLYVMAALTYLPVPALAGIKWASILFDLALASYAFRIVALRRPRRLRPALGAAVVVLLLPTVVVNSGWWGQADAIFTTFLVGGLYHLLRDRPWWACAFFGIALAFKLQAVFLFPLLLVLVLVKRIPWPSLLAVPAVYLALDVPALLLGADPWKLLTVYTRQTGTYTQLTLNAPSVYQFVSVPQTAEGAVRSVGVLIAGATVLVLVGLAVRSVRRAGGAVERDGRPLLTPTTVLLLATTSAIAVPFLLPSMHERYFYVADVLSVIVAFHRPHRLWYLPILVQASSLGSYLTFIAPAVAPYLSMPAHGMLMLLALIAVLRSTARELRGVPAPAAVRSAVPGGSRPAAPRIPEPRQAELAR